MFINHKICGAPEMRAIFTHHDEHPKSDAFILTSRTENGTLVFLQDGGFDICHQIDGLLALRMEMLTALGLAHEAENPEYQLDITLLISHFHVDHVEALFTSILPSPFLHVNAAYYPACSKLAENPKYATTKNGDANWRPRVMEALRTYHPEAPLYEIPFGETREVPFGAGRMTVLMPKEDWGDPELTEYAADLYFADKPEERIERTGIPVVNANCLWVRAEMAGRVLLLTGDTMKRCWDVHDESMDRVMETYGSFLEADVIKYPHHGMKRDEAWPNVQKLLRKADDACVVLTGGKAFEQSGPYLTENNIPWLDVRGGTLTLTFSEKGITK